MIHYKTNEEIELIRESSLLVAKTLAEVARLIKPGITTQRLDQMAEEFIRDHQASPGFKGYNGFPFTLCISPNEVVVHGFPSKRELKEGEILSVDCGVLKNGYYGDSAYTFAIGEISESLKRLLKVTHSGLYLGIEQAVEGNTLGDVSWAIQQHAEQAGFSVVRELVGHGVGRHLHEAPEVPNYGAKGKGLKFKEGLVIAIEPMINMGQRFVVQERDGWTIRTSDRKPSAHFEHTIAVRQGKADVLSSFQYIEEALMENQNNSIIIR
ncbi:MAG: type I methionyl aminopeptidase [Bacteroidales bacterium]|jgi:methionyl aminopeptidase|nr:type I methionyl aminopeptidase [Bacteroidales bacterium]NLM91810.1 type I methionyl aminopeptidase [Bacteroidales bacterium]